MTTRGKTVTAEITSIALNQTDAVFQYDYGQQLEITGITNLPQSFEVQFSNEQNRGYTKTVIASEAVAAIPDEYLQTGKDIFAFVFLHDGQNDGETEYMIKIPVIRRPEPLDVQPTPEQQDVISQAIAAAENYAEQAQTAASSIPAIKTGILEESINRALDYDSSFTVLFPEAFATLPKVFLSLMTSLQTGPQARDFICELASRNKNGFTVNIRYIGDDKDGFTAVEVFWMAIA